MGEMTMCARKPHAFKQVFAGAVFAVLLLANPSWGQSETPTEDEQFHLFELNMDHGCIAEAKQAVETFGADFPESPRLAEIENRLAMAQTALEAPDEIEAAAGRLEQFLPGQRFGASAFAGQSQVHLAKVRVSQNRIPEALDLLVSIQAGNNLALALKSAKTRFPLCVYLGDLDGAMGCQAALQDAINRLGDADPLQRDLAQEYLDLIGDWSDEGAGADHLWAVGSVEWDIAQLLQGQDSPAGAALRDSAPGQLRPEINQSLSAAEAAWSEMLENSPSRDEVSLAGQDLANYAKRRFAAARASFLQGKYDRCRELTEEIYALRDNAAFADLALPACAKLWSLACDVAQGVADVETESALQEIVGSGRCGTEEVVWGMLQLAQMAEDRGDTVLQRDYLQDIADCVFSPSAACLAKQRLSKFDEEHPEAAAFAGLQRSPVYALWKQNDLFRLTADGKEKLLPFRVGERRP
jgi:hypothetical protein